MHHHFRLSLFQWNPGPARRNPTDIVSAACGKFHAVILQEASDHVPHIFVQFFVCTGNTDLVLLLKKNTSSLSSWFSRTRFTPQAGTWDMVLLIIRGLLRRPSLSASPTVAFCSVHIHNVAEKRRRFWPPSRSGHGRLWTTDFGQFWCFRVLTDFGQTDFGQF